MIESASGEEIDGIHKHLLVGVLDIGNYGNFLTIGAAFEENFGRVLCIVWGQQCHHVLLHHVAGWMAVRLHHLAEYVVKQHRYILPNGGGSGGWCDLEPIVNMGVKCVVHGLVDVAHCVVIVLVAVECGGDFEHLFARVGDDGDAILLVNANSQNGG